MNTDIYSEIDIDDNVNEIDDNGIEDNVNEIDVNVNGILELYNNQNVEVIGRPVYSLPLTNEQYSSLKKDWSKHIDDEANRINQQLKEDEIKAINKKVINWLSKTKNSFYELLTK